MTRHNIIRTLICSATVFLAVGCGDAGSTSGDAFPTDTIPTPEVGTTLDSSPALETELRLACESACDSVQACPGRFVTIDCTDDCVAAYSVDASEECTAAQIELLNCASGLSCSASLIDPECAEVRENVVASCPARERGVETVEEPGTEHVGELEERVWVDSEATESTVETEDDGSDTDLARDPVVVVKIPGAVELIEFPWLVVSDDD